MRKFFRESSSSNPKTIQILKTRKQTNHLADASWVLPDGCVRGAVNSVSLFFVCVWLIALRAEQRWRSVLRTRSHTRRNRQPKSTTDWELVQFISRWFLRAQESSYSLHPSEFSPVLPLKQFRCWSDWRWLFLVLPRKIFQRSLCLCLSLPLPYQGNPWCDALDFVLADSVSSSSTLQIFRDSAVCNGSFARKSICWWPMENAVKVFAPEGRWRQWVR